jgi:hypothetical protein
LSSHGFPRRVPGIVSLGRKPEKGFFFPPWESFYCLLISLFLRFSLFFFFWAVSCRTRWIYYFILFPSFWFVLSAGLWICVICIERFADFRLPRSKFVRQFAHSERLMRVFCSCFWRHDNDFASQFWQLVLESGRSISQTVQQLMSFTSVALFPKFCGSYIQVPFVCRREGRVFFPGEYESLAVHVQCSKQVLATEAIILFCSRNWEHPGLRLLYVVHCSLSLGRGLSAV